MEEIWKDVIGYEGLYQVSDTGNMRSISYHGKKKIKLLKLYASTHEYYVVSAHKDKIQSRMHVHREVAKCFCANPLNKPEVNHKNGVRTDNRADNLEWVTRSENNKHAYDFLGKTGPWQGKRGSDNPKSIPVLQFTLNGEFINKYPNAVIAEMETGIFQASIRAVCRMDYGNKTAGGYLWKYEERILSWK